MDFIIAVSEKSVALEFNLKKVREKSRECHNHKPQPFLDIKKKKKREETDKSKQAQIDQTYEKH